MTRYYRLHIQRTFKDDYVQFRMPNITDKKIPVNFAAFQIKNMIKPAPDEMTSQSRGLKAGNMYRYINIRQDDIVICHNNDNKIQTVAKVIRNYYDENTNEYIIDARIQYYISDTDLPNKFRKTLNGQTTVIEIDKLNQIKELNALKFPQNRPRIVDNHTMTTNHGKIELKVTGDITIEELREFYKRYIK